MTLSTTASRVSYPGTGSTGPFAFPFKIFAIPPGGSPDLVVTKVSSAGALATLAYPADYTVTGSGDATGTITLTVALAVGETLWIRRAPALTQPTSIRNQGTYFPATIEDEFDRLIMQMQSMSDKIDRSFGFGESFDPATLSLRLNAAPQTGQVLSFLTPTQLTASTLGTTTGVALPGENRTVPSLSAFLFNNRVYNVLDYGCIGDDVADDTLNYRKTITNVPTGGGILYMPTPPVAYKINGVLTMKTGLTVQGTGRDCCQIKQYGNVDTFFASSALGCREIVMRDFFINDAVAPASRTAGAGINLDGTGDAVTAVLERIFCNGHFDGVRVSRCLTSSYRDIRCNIQRRDSFAFYGPCSTSSVQSCYADAPIRHGYYWDGGSQYMHMINLACDAQGGDAYHVDAVPATNYCSFLTFTSCGSEAGIGTCYYFREGSGHVVIAPKLTGNNAANQHGLWADGAQRITVIGGQWFFVGGFGVKTTTSATPTVPNEIVLTGNDFNSCALGNVSDPVGAVTRWQGKTFSLGFSTGTPITATLVGRLISNIALAGNVGAAQTDLLSSSILGNTLIADGQALRVRAWGFTAGNATGKTIKLIFGADTVVNTGALALNAADWCIDIMIIRSGASAQFYSGMYGSSAAALLPMLAKYGAGAQAWSGNLTLKVAAQGGADNDIVQRGMVVEVLT